MYPSNAGNRNSWNPPDDPRMRPGWPSDDRQMYRRDDQNMPHPHSHPHSLEDRTMLPTTMLPPHGASSIQPGEPMYPHQQLPPPSDMWPVSREPIHPVQPAPRQRTAIACRYCRRRKIRCSGFDSSQDGRCTNCLRFNQECVFTPVSSQAQAFVPAHTQYPHLKQGFIPPRGGPARPVVQLYGSFGQPLPLNALQPHQSEYMPQNYGRPPSPGHYSRSYDDPAYERERSRRDERPPSLPPLVQNYPHNVLQRRGSAGDYPMWRNSGTNPPPSPPPTLPPPRQYSPQPRTNGNYSNGNFPPTTSSGQPPASYSTDYDRQYHQGPASHPDSMHQGPPKRRLSDPRESETARDSRYPENPAFPYKSNSPARQAGVHSQQPPPRSSSAGPQAPPSHPMQLSNLMDPPTGPQRSDADNRMLKSLNWKP